jgi:hypothetical protein
LTVYCVEFANGQVAFCGSPEEADRIARRRIEHDPPPPGVLPTKIWELRGEGEPRLVDEFPQSGPNGSP